MQILHKILKKYLARQKYFNHLAKKLVAYGYDIYFCHLSPWRILGFEDLW
jgi:hypothetical protein